MSNTRFARISTDDGDIVMGINDTLNIESGKFQGSWKLTSIDADGQGGMLQDGLKSMVMRQGKPTRIYE